MICHDNDSITDDKSDKTIVMHETLQIHMILS